MVINSIKLDGMELVGGNYLFHLSGFQDFEKDVITSDMLIDGEAWGRSKNKPRTLVLEGSIVSGGIPAEWELNRSLSGNGLKTIVINNTYQGQAEVTSRGSNADNSRIVSCQLTMPDPHWYSIDTSSVSLGASYSSGVVFGLGHGVVFGLGQGFTFGVSIGAAGTVINSGNAVSYPVITIVGTCSAISLKSITTGEEIDVNAQLTDSDTLKIDCRPKTCGVWLNGVRKIALKATAGWIHCPPGENKISFSRNSLQDKRHCTVELQSRWM